MRTFGSYYFCIFWGVFTRVVFGTFLKLCYIRFRPQLDLFQTHYGAFFSLRGTHNFLYFFQKMLCRHQSDKSDNQFILSSEVHLNFGTFFKTHYLGAKVTKVTFFRAIFVAF